MPFSVTTAASSTATRLQGNTLPLPSLEGPLSSAVVGDGFGGSDTALLLLSSSVGFCLGLRGPGL